MRYNIAHLIWFQIKVFPPSNNMQLGPINYNILSPIVSFSFLSISTISVLKKRQAGQSQCNLLYSSTTGVINLKTTKSRHTFTFQQKTVIHQLKVSSFFWKCSLYQKKYKKLYINVFYLLVIKVFDIPLREAPLCLFRHCPFG